MAGLRVAGLAALRFNVVMTTMLMPGLVPMSLFDPETLLRDLGPWALAGVVLIVFIESGLLFPFLPGDSLLFVAGLMHTQMNLNLWVLILATWAAAVAGDSVGYWIGEKWGRRLFTPDARILKTEYLNRAEDFFARYGGRSIIMARLVPIVRTFVPVAVGATKYPYAKFLSFNVFGGLGWVTVMILAGTLLGGVSFVANNIDLICIGIVAVSVIPVVVQLRRSLKESAEARQQADDE